MIWTITKRDIHDNLLSAKFALAAILCLSLTIPGVYVSIKDYEKRMGEKTGMVAKYFQFTTLPVTVKGKRMRGLSYMKQRLHVLFLS